MKAQRIGHRVYCINCGAVRGVTFHKWRDFYICDACHKYLNNIGEEAFIDQLRRRFEEARKEAAAKDEEEIEEIEEESEDTDEEEDNQNETDQYPSV